jgi:alpha-galactosidase
MISKERIIESTDHGYTYVNIDDGWEAPARAANGEILCNEKFPDMKVTADYVHSKGLRFGIYSSPGPLTCGRYLGSYQHELQDAETYANMFVVCAVAYLIAWTIIHLLVGNFQKVSDIS